MVGERRVKQIAYREPACMGGGGWAERVGSKLRARSAASGLCAVDWNGWRDVGHPADTGSLTVLPGLRCDGRQLSDDRADYCPDGTVEPLGAERGIITKVKVDVAPERAIGIERGPAATAHLVALVRTLP
jgi:hypothetical protein